MAERSEVQIIRDVDGIAHVRAPDRDGAFFGQGYACAVDRLWQMEFDRRKALGRLAEVIGTAALDADRYHRRLAIAAAARDDLAHLRPETVAMLTAYADGVNAALDHLADDPAPRPIEFEVLDAPRPERWEPWHCIAVYKVRHLWMGTSEIKLWRTALVATVGADAARRLWPAGAGTVIDPSELDDLDAVVAEAMPSLQDEIVALADTLGTIGDVGASNNLVIDGAHTTTGSPIVAGDPHRAIDLPNCYWQNHIRWGGDASSGGDVIGLSFAGVPGFPHFGHNADVAWCITHGMADDHDLFVDRVRSTDNGIEHLVDDRWLPAEAHDETIAVAGGSDETVTVVRTTNGHVIAGGPPRPGDPDAIPVLTMRWTATDAPDSTMDCLSDQMQADSVASLDRAFTSWVLPGNNVLAADRAGDIAYRFRGRLATRPSTNGWTVVDGTTSATAWTGFVPDEDLRRVHNPDRGFLVTANSQVSTRGPYISHDWAHPARARRLTERLAGEDPWSPDAVAALLGDTASSVAATIARRAASVPVEDASMSAVQAMLASWDGHMDATSPEALVVAAIRAEIVARVTDTFGAARAAWPPGVGYTTAQMRRAMHLRVGFVADDVEVIPDAMVAESLAGAVAMLTDRFGSDPNAWRWADAHTAQFHHPLALLRPDLADALPVPDAVGLGGDNECVWASGTTPPSLRSVTSPVARYVFDLSDWDASGWVVPHGVDGDLRRHHGRDQLAAWADLRLHPMRYSTDAVDGATRSVERIIRDPGRARTV